MRQGARRGAKGAKVHRANSVHIRANSVYKGE